ncbi:helix-turn-helix transcriptional regulator [Crossiella sp. CA-258035]|uniref:helix-turn-helix domain-containing protein n=1 Tax=Crossiella sp. CA-258035 TaxID=2981138 RepID=UPI0024BC4331|nr:helix-turn-helix transcriptional regulator [Crossiella sp. CA-258035]WHT19222.1 helix-turn-helix transcriptional regulator [Crossiella sp. CA-258035]
MGAKPGPTLRAQWLGKQLNELRSAAGMTLKQAGEYLQRDTSTVSRFESGEYPVRRPDLLALLDFYQVTSKRKREVLIALHEDAWQQGWWDDFADDVDQKLIDYVWLESRSTEIRSFDCTLLNGLLQTEDYARALISGASPTADQAQLDRWVELRMSRMALLDRPRPPKISVVMDEVLLHREVGGRQVLAGQLAHLVELAERPNIEIRLLRYSAGALPSQVVVPFKLLLAGEPYPAVGYIETLAGNLYVEPPKTQRFAEVYDQLVAAALGPEETIRVIARTAEEKACR